MYPSKFPPTGTEAIDVDGHTLFIPKCTLRFDKWSGKPIKETFGGKALVTVADKPMFAELAIMTHFANEGWDARWVSTYGKKKPIYLTEWVDDKFKNQVHRPFKNHDVENLLAGISKLNGNTYAGCWDVIAWKDRKIVFAESKRTSRDNIRRTQIKWLAAAIQAGLQPDNFLIVQWDM